MATHPDATGAFRFAHFSDVHLPVPHGAETTGLTLKQKLGFRKRLRSRAHDPAAVEACLRTLAALEVRHLCVTGDLVHLGTAPEIEAAAEWLAGLRRRGFVCHLVPGNHDAVTAAAKRQALAAWSREFGGSPERPPAFPYRTDAGPVSFLGLDTSRITPPGLACGRIDRRQLDELECLLEATGRARRFRVILLHHPPVPGVESPRRRLYGIRRFRQILHRRGAELVLHGHVRQPLRADIRGPRVPIPVFGAAPLSELPPDTNFGPRFTLFTLGSASGPLAFEARTFGWDGRSATMEPIAAARGL